MSGLLDYLCATHYSCKYQIDKDSPLKTLTVLSLVLYVWFGKGLIEKQKIHKKNFCFKTLILTKT